MGSLNVDTGIYAYLEIDISGVNIGRMIFKLYKDICPKTVENFRCLCTGERGAGVITKAPLSYKASRLHRVIKGFMVQGGDFELGDGRGGESIYGGKFNDEVGGLALRHSKRGLLCMANSGKDTNGSQFFILFKEAHHLNGKHVVFGEMVEGRATLDAIEGVGTGPDDKPTAPVTICQCGQLERRGGGPKRSREKEKVKTKKKKSPSTGSSSSSPEVPKKKKKKVSSRKRSQSSGTLSSKRKAKNERGKKRRKK